MSLVTVSVVGNLVRPPEQLYFASGRVKTNFVLAVNQPSRRGKDIITAEYYRVETWGKLAELAGKYLAKGNQVAVCGRLLLDHWTDKQGKSRVTPIVEATQMALPPRLKVVLGDNQAAEPAVGNTPIGGDLTFDEQTGEEDFDAHAAACGDSPLPHPPVPGDDEEPHPVGSTLQTA